MPAAVVLVLDAGRGAAVTQGCVRVWPPMCRAALPSFERLFELCCLALLQLETDPMQLGMGLYIY